MGILKGTRWLPRDVAHLCHNHGWRDLNLVLFVATIGGESDYYDEAEGDPHPDGTIDEGLFQLNSIHMGAWGFTSFDAFKQMAYDPSQAVIYARKLWESDVKAGGTGFGPWYAFSNGGYKNFTKSAIVGVANYFATTQGLEPQIRWNP